MKYTVLALLATCAGVAVADNWAVLVCGSNGYSNYRHHADICHAYQILKKNGMPEDHIITMLYDDVPTDPQNPFPGTLYNAPSTGPGVDVYAGCKKSYTGSNVTAENFLNVIKGNATAMYGIGSGEVLKSGPDDHVFINYVDHGGFGLVAMPVGDFLYADDLLDAMNYMYTNQMYSQLVFYMEACESGSMFQSLPPNITAFAETAANANEPSWGTYCPPDDKVDGTELGTCLGDLYSVMWMQDSDRRGAMKESLVTQYKIVKNETNLSHVSIFGNKSFISEPIGEFQGSVKWEQASLRGPDSTGALLNMVRREPAQRSSSSVDSRNANLQSMMYRYSRATSPAVRESLSAAIAAELKSQAHFDAAFSSLARSWFGDAGSNVNALLASTADAPFEQWSCYRAGNDAVASSACGSYSDYSLKYARVVAMMCDKAMGDAGLVTAAVTQACNDVE